MSPDRDPALTLDRIDIESGVNVKGEPFIHVVARTAAGGEVMGQLDPFDARRMALDWLETSEAAVHDAAVFVFLRDRLEVPAPRAAVVIAELRNYRVDMHVSRRDERGEEIPP